MIELNDNSINVGQIKQVLKNFNLPNCKIGRSYPAANSLFIDKERYRICKWDNDKEESIIEPYLFNKNYLNITSNLIIKNMFYDRETHRYLGKYLRFIRDFNDINLMSMYNCFDGEVNDLSVSSFGGLESDFVTYKIPVSRVSTYTICTFNKTNIELCYSLNCENKATVDDIKLALVNSTYIKTRCNNIYYFEPSLPESIYPYMDRLVILLKVPRKLDTSIVILEGKYYSYNSSNNLSNKPQYIKYKNALTGELMDSGFKIYPQLLSSQAARKQYLLADKLIQYLIETSAITSSSEPYYIKAVQKALMSLDDEDKITTKEIQNFGTDRYYGIWHNLDTLCLKALINKNINKASGNYNPYDNIAFIDTDAEKILKSLIDKYLLSDTTM